MLGVAVTRARIINFFKEVSFFVAGPCLVAGRGFATLDW
jgi:hypothetical protein